MSARSHRPRLLAAVFTATALTIASIAGQTPAKPAADTARRTTAGPTTPSAMTKPDPTPKMLPARSSEKSGRERSGKRRLSWILLTDESRPALLRLSGEQRRQPSKEAGCHCPGRIAA
jgi:hypothetical protein